MKKWLVCVMGILLLMPLSGVAAQDAVPATATGAEARKPITISESSSLPLRVLTRPMSNLYSGPDEASGIAQGNLPAFLPYYVYTRPGGEERGAERGWYEVGSDNRGSVVGWLKTADVFEWKQTMVLAFAHPEGRNPVLMFDEEKPLSELVIKDPATRASAVKDLYETIESNNIPKDFSIVSIEPKMFVDFTKQFYLLPILDHKVINVDGREGRILELAAVSGAAPNARERTDIRANKEYREKARISPADAAGGVANELAFDIVWVIDTTLSMGPYADATRDVVVAVSKQLTGNEELSKRLRFGAWGYRDSIIEVPGLEYLTKNYTPELQDIQSFGVTMGTVKETKVDSGNFPEDMFSGVSDAIQKTKWTPGAARILILVGDAPGHELGHKRNASSLDETTAHTLAAEKNITLMAIQIRPQGAVRHQKIAERQFKALSLNSGTDTPAYYSVDSRNIQAFSNVTATLVASLQGIVQAAQQGNLAQTLASETNLVGGEMAALLDKGDDEAKQAVATGNEGLNQALRAGLVQWIGSEAGAEPPRDVVAWVADKDLTDTTKQSLEVRLLINKRQLDSLAILLGDIIQAGRKGQISGDDFFTSLQAASAVASRDPDQLKAVKSLGQSGLIPNFLSGLPYHSRLMDMSNELWASWSPDEQDNFMNELDARGKAYRALHDNPQGWIQLNEGADADESVYPIPLDLLP